MTAVRLSSGTTLNVEVDGSGPPLVLLHGFTGSARSWGEFGKRLAASRTVVAVDIIGHGQSDKPADVAAYRMERAARNAVEAVERLGFQAAPWLGYSMGGRLALYIAVAHQERVERLVLIGASAGLAGAEARRARVASDEALAERIEHGGIEAFVDEWERLPLWASQARLPAGVRESIRAGRLANDPRGLAGSLRGMGTGAQPALHDRLATVEIPALLLAGEADERYVAIGHELAAALPGGRFEAIPEAGHAAHLENPRACAKAVERFLAEPGAELAAG
jgi:2-succinyl-6-hydroxy-2,4-cyclohexadiene-1-carboxylate synthase